MIGAPCCWHCHQRSSVWHAFEPSFAKSFCRLVRSPVGYCVAEAPRGARACRLCRGVLRRVRGPRYAAAVDYAHDVSGNIEQRVPAQVRTWPPAIAFITPISERLSALLLEWELTGRRELTVDIHDATRELLSAWYAALAEWNDTPERRR